MVQLQEYCSLAQISVFHKNPSIFVASQWQHDKSQPNTKYLLYRTCHAAFLFITWVQTLNGSWYTFLSNWVYTLLAVQSIICWVMLIDATVNNGLPDDDSGGCVSKSHSVYWAFHAASNASCFLITIIYLTAIYGSRGANFTDSNLFVHGSNPILTFLDICVTAHPVHLLHCLYPLILGVTYLAFTFAYYYDRGRGDFGFWVLEISIYLILLHVLTFIIYKLRVIAYNKITKGSTQSQEKNHNSTLPV